MSNSKNIFKMKKEKTKIIINIDRDIKDDFKKICEENNLNMTNVLEFTIKQIIEKGELTDVNYRYSE